MRYAKVVSGDHVRFCRIKRRGSKNCRVVWLDTLKENLEPLAALQNCTAEDAGVTLENTTESRATVEETPELIELSGGEVCRLMRAYQSTIGELAKKLGVTKAKVRQVRHSGVQGVLLVHEWKTAIVGDNHEPVGEDHPSVAVA